MTNVERMQIAYLKKYPPFDKAPIPEFYPKMIEMIHLYETGQVDSSAFLEEEEYNPPIGKSEEEITNWKIKFMTDVLVDFACYYATSEE